MRADRDLAPVEPVGSLTRTPRGGDLPPEEPTQDEARPENP
jgi:hypothetical protein